MRDDTHETIDTTPDYAADAPDGFKTHEGEGYGAPPDRDGKQADEVVGHYRWDANARAWVEFRGVDRTKNVPEGYEHVGDGTPGNPHRVSLIQRW